MAEDSVTSLLHRLVNRLRKADAEDYRPVPLFNKNVDADKYPALDSTRSTDSWSDPSERRVDASRDSIGPRQRASGEGAPAMISDYSDDAGEGDMVTRQYQEMADALRNMQSVQADTIKAISRLAEEVAVLAGSSKSFPKSEVEPEEDDENDED